MISHLIWFKKYISLFFRAENIKSQKAGSSIQKNDDSLPQQLDIKKLRIASVKQNQNNKAKKGGLTKQEIEVLRLANIFTFMVNSHYFMFKKCIKYLFLLMGEIISNPLTTLKEEIFTGRKFRGFRGFC